MFISLVLKEMQSLIMLSACTLVHRKVDARVSNIISFIVVPFLFVLSIFSANVQQGQSMSGALIFML